MKPKLSISFIFAHFIAFLTVIMPVHSQVTKHFDNYSGLSSQRVGGGIQDKNGLMWFATWNGLNCYDGYDFHWVNIKPGDNVGISTGRLRDILLSPEGNIWCHTDNGIYEFNLSTYTFREIPLKKQKAIGKHMGKNWRGLTDTQGNLWTADREGLYLTSFPHHPASIIKGTEGEWPRAFAIDNIGYLWMSMCNSHCIKVFDTYGNIARTITLDTAPYAMLPMQNGRVWVGGKPGRLLRIEANGQQTVVSDDIVYDIKEDIEGHLWIATFGGGIKVCETPDGTPVSVSPPIKGTKGMKVRRLLITPSGNIFATTTEGLLAGRIDDKHWQGTSLKLIKRDASNANSLSNNATMDLVQDSKGNIYVGTESSGIDMISEKDLIQCVNGGQQPVFRHFNVNNSSLTSDFCKAMTIANDSLIVVVADDNVTAFNPITDQSVNYGRIFWSDSVCFEETKPLILKDDSWILGTHEGALLASAHSLYSRGYVPPLVFTTLAIKDGGADFCLVPLNEISLQADQRSITIGYAALDYTDNSGILYRSRLDGSTWCSASKNRSITLFNLSAGSHTLELQSTDRYGRWVDNNRIITITVAPYWYETWWAKLLFLLTALAIIAGITYTYLYIRKVNLQRRQLLEKYMKVLARTMETGTESRIQTPKLRITTGKETKTLSAEDTRFLDRVRKYIDQNISNPDANVGDMAEAAAASRSTLNRHLHSLLGISASQLLIEARMQRARQLLAKRDETEYSIAHIAEKCGYYDTHYFQRAFKQKHGVSPSEWNNRENDEE
jgi:AraC-like DNA-binding protein/sugar lactone lactonase YvrE